MWTAETYISLAAVVPSFLGMAAGRRIRGKLGEKRFQAIFYVSLLLLGLFILRQCLN